MKIPGFVKDIAIKVLGFAVAKTLEALPDEKFEAICEDGGKWFTDTVTPYIGERSETAVQYLKNKCNIAFDRGADYDEEVD